PSKSSSSASMTTEVSSNTALVTSVLDAVVAEDHVIGIAIAVPLLHVDGRELSHVLLELPHGLPPCGFPPVRHQVGDRLAIAGDDEALPRLDPSHDLAAVVAQLPLGDDLR